LNAVVTAGRFVAAAAAVVYIFIRAACIPLADDAPEAEAAGFIKEQRLQGRMLTFFDWGEYAIWHLAPDVKVSMDGRRETVYSQALIDAHSHLYWNRPDATDVVGELNPDFVWLPASMEALSALEREGWLRIFSGPVSVILARRTDGPPKVVTTTMTPALRRCFPGL
jgi:hypothetical protein